MGYFSGAIDEARIWNRALLPAEILANKNLELTSGTGLMARWGMAEGSGTTINSSVGTFPGTLTNGPTWVAGFPIPDVTRLRRPPGSEQPRPRMARCTSGLDRQRKQRDGVRAAAFHNRHRWALQPVRSTPGRA